VVLSSWSFLLRFAIQSVRLSQAAGSSLGESQFISTIFDIFTHLRINVVSMVFLLVFMIPHIGYSWLNYILPVSCFLCLPLLVTVKEEYKRMEREEEQ
jgi:hypothetical protein